MTWYYASGGQQMGPVDEAALDDLMRQGVVRDDTLVWRQGLPGWQPHGTARPRPAAPLAAAPAPLAASAPLPSAPAQAAAPVATPSAASPAAAWPGAQSSPATPQAAPAQEMRFCSNCGRPTPVSQLTTVNGASICAACLPSVTGAGAAPAAAAPQPGYQQGPGYQPAPAYPVPGAYAPAMGYPPGAMGGQTRYGGFWIRFLARVIDTILLGIAGMIIRIPLMLLVGGVGLGLSNAQDPTAALAALPALFGVLGLSILINIALAFFYEIYFLTSRGATPGKMALGLKVIRADGGPITMGLAVGRYFAYILSSFTFFIGFIIAGFDDQKRSLHDRICDTRVIKL
jgi:uncharacterized RDD family membrane protein YckC